MRGFVLASREFGLFGGGERDRYDVDFKALATNVSLRKKKNEELTGVPCLVVEEMLSRVEPELKDDLGVDMFEEDIV